MSVVDVTEESVIITEPEQAAEPEQATEPVSETPAEKPPEPAQTPFEPPADPTPNEDIERLLPSPGEPFELADGTKVVANELRLKEFLGLLKIVTRGAAMSMGEVRLNTNDEEFAQSMISLFVFAIPEAEDEAADFIRMMVRPAGPFANNLAEADAKVHLDEVMANPDLDDLFTIIEVVINSEGKDLRRLGKRLVKAMEFAQKTGQIERT